MLLNGANTYNIYLYTAQKGTGSKFSFCVIPPNVGIVVADLNANPPVLANPGTPSPANDCTYWTNYTADATGFTTTSNGVDLNKISIRRNASDASKVDIKFNQDATWVI